MKGCVYMDYDEKLKRFAQLFESDRISNLSLESLKHDFNISNCKVVTYPGKKYTKVDCNGSGVYMVDNVTEEIFGIKAYGVPHKGQRFGTLDTITNYYWGDYRARIAAPSRESIEIQSADEILKAKGLHIGKGGKIYGGQYGEEPEESQEPVKVIKTFQGDKYKELFDDLLQAANQGKEAAGFVSDGGTCNLDCIFLTLPKFNEDKAIDAIHQAGLSGHKTKSPWFGTGFLISPPCVGQARKREVAAETMYKNLKAKNWDVAHWQQMN